MHPILAEDIGPGIFWILVLFAGIGCSVLAFVAIFPAALGRLRLAMLMAAPAFAFSILLTIMLVYFFFTAHTTSHSPRDEARQIKNFWVVWFLFSGIPLALSLFVMLLAMICSRIRKSEAH
jgi:hypothetical protein